MSFLSKFGHNATVWPFLHGLNRPSVFVQGQNLVVILSPQPPEKSGLCGGFLFVSGSVKGHVIFFDLRLTRSSLYLIKQF